MRRILGFIAALATLAYCVVALPVDAHSAFLGPLRLADPGPQAAGWTEVNVSAAGGRTFGARLYYPAIRPGGENAPLDWSAAPYPAITFGHGFVQPVQRYDSTLSHLATWGMLVIAPESEVGLFPSHSQFADDLSSSLTWLSVQNATTGTLLYHAVDTTRFGASGHSMGGGASILAAARDPRIITVSNLAPAETRPSAIAAMSQLFVPIELTAGSDDTIVPPVKNQQAMYQNGHAPKQAPTIIGGYHCGFLDVGKTPAFGCDHGTISQTMQLSLTRGLLTAWFRLYFGKPHADWQAVWGLAPHLDQTVTFQGDDGIAIQPKRQAGTTLLGQPITYTLKLTNTRSTTSAYKLAVESSSPAAVTPTQTDVLPPHSVAVVTVTVTPAKLGQQGLTLTAQSVVDDGTTTWATMITTSTKSTKKSGVSPLETQYAGLK